MLFSRRRLPSLPPRRSYSLLGATTVFVDIDPSTFNIDPDQLKETITAIQENDQPIILSAVSFNRMKSSSRRRHSRGSFWFAGRLRPPSIQSPIEYGLTVIEDAAQSFGGEYKGRKAGSLADIACTSFFPAKPLGCYGDGGMCFTNDDDSIEIMKSLRVHGKGGDKYDNIRIGINGRMDTLQAAILLEKFAIFPEEVRLRNKVANQYQDTVFE